MGSDEQATDTSRPTWTGQHPSSWYEFLADLRLAGRAWRTSPWLPVVTVLVSVIGSVGYSSQADPVMSLAGLLRHPADLVPARFSRLAY
jgi:hypothetical protein